MRDRMYFDVFGSHPNLWKFIRCLRNLQEAQENEELQYRGGGNILNRARRENIDKENNLRMIRQFFVSSPQSLEDAYGYVKAVCGYMRKYNMEGNDIEVDEDV